MYNSAKVCGMTNEIETEQVRDHPYAQWVKRLKDFDAEAWDVLLQYNAVDLRRDIRASLQKRGLAEDLVDDIEQETWLTAVRKIGDFIWENEEKLYNWLRVIALNHIRMYQRGMSKNLLINDIVPSDTDEELDRFQAAWGEAQKTVEDAIVLRELYTALDKALATLKSNEQEIFVSWLMGEAPRRLALTYHMKPRS